VQAIGAAKIRGTNSQEEKRRIAQPHAVGETTAKKMPGMVRLPSRSKGKRRPVITASGAKDARRVHKSESGGKSDHSVRSAMGVASASMSSHAILKEGGVRGVEASKKKGGGTPRGRATN